MCVAAENLENSRGLLTASSAVHQLLQNATPHEVRVGRSPRKRLNCRCSNWTRGSCHCGRSQCMSPPHSSPAAISAMRPFGGRYWSSTASSCSVCASAKGPTGVSNIIVSSGVPGGSSLGGEHHRVRKRPETVNSNDLQLEQVRD